MIHKIRVLSICLLCILSLLGLGVNKVFADTVTIDNDGYDRSEEALYGDSGIPSSFEAVDYIDCYIPYNLTCEDVGGYSTGYEWRVKDYCVAMPEYYKGNYMGTIINRQTDAFEGGGCYASFSNGFYGTPSYDPETDCNIVTDEDGTVYYLTAIQRWFYYGLPDGFPEWGTDRQTGQVFDVILTDGTVIHFIVGDSNAVYHTNGGDLNKDGTVLRARAGHDAQFTFSELLLEQYRHLYAVMSGGQLELWGKAGCVNKFLTKYNIGVGEGKARIAYYRMYNLNVEEETPVRSFGVPEGSSYSLGNVNIVSGTGLGSSSGSSGGLSWGGNAIPDEIDLIGMDGTQTTYKENQQGMNLPTLDDLSIKDRQNVLGIANTLQILKEEESLNNMRIGVVFIGLFFLLYSIMLLLAWLFDKSNQFIEISLLGIISFGMLKFSEEDETIGKKGYMNFKKLVVTEIVCLFTGLFLISGSMYLWIIDLAIFFQSIF